MSDPFAPTGAGQTELSEEDREGLLLSYVTTRGELNDAEQRNIVDAMTGRRSPAVLDLLDDAYLRGLHQAMFGRVWRWAGRYRHLATNIGVEPARIATEVRSLVEDARIWVELGTFEPDELCVRFHHRLVSIHPFPNGNGRHGRISADYLIAALGREPFGWGAGLIVDTRALRAAYVAALQRADRGNLDDLVSFARSSAGGSR